MSLQTNNFNILRNLYFYKGHYPSYFYFSSLLYYRMDNNPIYNARATEVMREGYDALTSGFLEQAQANEQDSQAMDSFKKIMSFLQKAIEYEKKNELNYFKQKYALLKANFTQKEFLSIKEIHELEELFSSPEKFNYEQFLVLINTLLQGFENTKAIVGYEKERINSISAGVDKITTVYHNRLVGLAKKMGMYYTDAEKLVERREKMLDRNTRKHARNLELTYLEQGRLSGTKKVRRKQANGKYKKVTVEKFSGIKKYVESIRGTVEVEIAHWVTDQVKKIVEDPKIMSQLLDYVQNWYIKNIGKDDETFKNLEEDIKGVIIQSLMTYGSTHIPDILSKVYKKMSIDDITDVLSKSLNAVFSYDIEGLYNNIGQMGLTLDLFKEATNIDDLNQNSAEQLYEAHKRMREWFRDNADKITDEQRYTARSLHILTKEKDPYAELMQMIDDLETLQERYEHALTYHEKLIKPVVRSKLAKQDDGKMKSQEKWNLQIKMKDGKIDLDYLKAEVKKADPDNKFIRYLSDLRATSLEGLIAGLKTRVSNQMKKDIIAAVDTLSTGDAYKQGGIITKLRDGLQHMYISVGGPKLSEFRQGILESGIEGLLSQHHTGPVQRKNDFVTISLKYDEKLIGKIVSEGAVNQDTVQALSTTMADSQDALVESYAQEFSQYFYKELSKVNGEFDHNSYKKNAEIFFNYVDKQTEAFDNLSKESTKTSEAWKKYKDAQVKANESQEKLDMKRKEILTSLKDSFFVSSTMKTYNQYQNKIGFIGGSVGANLLEQLSNFADLFEEAGTPISSSDMDWLIGAIINCSPYSIIGERNKNIIENYLGAMAAFTIFDEGLAEMQIINALENPTNEIINSSPNILHIYSVNGIYVPGSYVLQAVYDHLAQCLNLMELGLQNINHQGAGVMIYNTMTEQGVPNRKSKTNPTGRIVTTHPWEKIGEDAQKKVSLKVVFLGGLMEILNKMNDVMSQIELPT